MWQDRWQGRVGQAAASMQIPLRANPLSVCADATRQRVALGCPVNAGNKLLLLLFLVWHLILTLGGALSY